MPFCIGWVENFDEITLSCTVKKIEANFRFWQKFENSKWPPFLGRGKFFENFLDTLWVEHFTEITLFCTVKANLCFSILGQNSKKSRTVKEIEANSCFAFFSIQNSQLLIYLINYSLIYEAKIRKFKMAAIFGEGKFF